MVLVRNQKKAPVSAVYSESHLLIMFRLKAYDFRSLLARRNNSRGMTMEERLDVLLGFDLIKSYLIERLQQLPLLQSFLY